MKTEQTNFWEGDFGKEYTDRNTLTPAELDKLYVEFYGITKKSINSEFMDGLDRNIRILEVGCNVGQQLCLLQEAGFKNLYGIEVQAYAVEKSKSKTKNINIIQGSGFDIPFKDGYFDLVYTCGVLIHIHPNDLKKIMGEMHRVTSQYVWGFEYHDEETKQINYRGHDGFLWKTDFSKRFSELHPDLKEVKRKLYPYIAPSYKGNVDCMYLLKK